MKIKKMKYNSSYAVVMHFSTSFSYKNYDSESQLEGGVAMCLRGVGGCSCGPDDRAACTRHWQHTLSRQKLTTQPSDSMATILDKQFYPNTRSDYLKLNDF